MSSPLKEIAGSSVVAGIAPDHVTAIKDNGSGCIVYLNGGTSIGFGDVPRATVEALLWPDPDPEPPEE